MPRESVNLSQLELMLLTIQPFSSFLFNECLASDSLVALSQCSTTLHAHIFHHTTLISSEVDLRCPELDELRAGPADGTAWQDVGRVFPRGPPYTTLPKNLPRFIREKSAPARDATAMRRAYGYWASNDWAPTCIIDFVALATKFNKLWLRSIHLNQHPGVTDKVLRFLLIGPKDVHSIMKPGEEFHLPKLRFLGVKGCANLTLRGFVEIFEDLAICLRSRWGYPLNLSFNAFRYRVRKFYPLRALGFAGAFTNDPVYIDAAFYLEIASSMRYRSWAEVVSSLGWRQTNFRETVFGWLNRDDGTEDVGIYDDLTGYGFTPMWRLRDAIEDAGLKQILQLDVVQHGAGLAENLAISRTSLFCVGCEEEISSWWSEKGDSSFLDLQRIHIDMVLCREPSQCNVCSQWYCAECKGFICKKCREETLETYPPESLQYLTKTAWVDMGRFSNLDTATHLPAAIPNPVPSGLIFVTCIQNVFELPQSIRTTHWWCRHCRPQLLLRLCPHCDHFNCPYQNCLHQTKSSECVTCEQSVCASCTSSGLGMQADDSNPIHGDGGGESDACDDYATTKGEIEAHGQKNRVIKAHECHFCLMTVCAKVACASICSLCLSTQPYSVTVCRRCTDQPINRTVLGEHDLYRQYLAEKPFTFEYQRDHLRIWGRSCCCREGCENPVLICNDCDYPSASAIHTDEILEQWAVGRSRNIPSCGQRGYYSREYPHVVSANNTFFCSVCVEAIVDGRWEEGRMLMMELYSEEEFWKAQTEGNGS